MTAEAITTRPPSPAEAGRLGLAPGMALLRIVRLARSPVGRPLEINDARISGDEFEIRYPLSRDPSAQRRTAGDLLKDVRVGRPPVRQRAGPGARGSASFPRAGFGRRSGGVRQSAYGLGAVGCRGFVRRRPVGRVTSVGSCERMPSMSSCRP